jgi:transmembrane sensor
MTGFLELSAVEQTRLEEASGWRLRLEQKSDDEGTPDFLEWIRDPANREAFELVSAGLDYIDQFQTSPELLAFREGALGEMRQLGAKRWRPRSRLMTAAAVAISVVVLFGGIDWYIQRPTDYTTQIGERRIITLSDGSKISLDSNSEVHVQYSAHARDLELIAGRARFDVAHDVTRPFSVAAGSETVVAVGTAFDVERLGSRVLVTLIQGHVVIKSPITMPGPVAKPQIALAAGQEMVASADIKPIIKPADLKMAAAWEAGQLVFHNEALGDAVEQVNRYAVQPISIDPAVASIRVTGVFNAGDTNSFLSAVTGYLPIVASTTADNRVVLLPRPGP